jgi:hypothetical protein
MKLSSSKGQAVFSPALLVGLALFAIAAFMLSLYLASREDNTLDSVGPNSYSRSAIGYAGLAEILRRLDVPVIQSRHNSLRKAGVSGLLVVAEPHWDAEEDLHRLLLGKKVLLVLSKWRGRPDERKTGWLTDAQLRLTAEAEMTLQLVLSKGTVAQEPSEDKWTVNLLKQEPHIHGPVQLITSGKLRPIVASARGILVGELTLGNNRKIWIVSDPDVLSNHRLLSNAVFAMALMDGARAMHGGGPQGRVVFDEVIHGFKSEPISPLKMLFTYPFYIVALQGLLGAGLLLWAAMGRFGSTARPPAPLSAGKKELLDNVARLMEYAGHHKVMLHRYIRAAVRDAGRQIHAPRNLDDAELVKWLQRAGSARGVTLDCGEILHRADELLGNRKSGLGSFVALARDIYRWKREIIDGPSRNPQGDRSGSR